MKTHPPVSRNVLPSSVPPAPPLPPTGFGEDPARLGLLEQKMAVVVHRIDEMSSRHETVPTRVTKLEGQFEHMAGQLVTLNKGQQKLTTTVAEIGIKVTRLLTIMTVLGVLVQLVAPTLFRLVFP